MTAAATATKPAKSATKTSAKDTKAAAKVTTPAPKPTAATVTTSTAKAQPPEKVATFITTLTTPEERRYATKQWRFTAGHRSSAPSLRGITQEQAKSIRDRIAQLSK